MPVHSHSIVRAASDVALTAEECPDFYIIRLHASVAEEDFERFGVIGGVGLDILEVVLPS